MPLNPQAIRAARERLGLTQKQAAEAAGMPRPHWSRLEIGGQPNPQLSTLEAVLTALPGLTLPDLIRSK